MKTTPLITNAGSSTPVWFEPNGFIKSRPSPVVHIGSICNTIHAEAIDELIESLKICKIEYLLYAGLPPE